MFYYFFVVFVPPWNRILTTRVLTKWVRAVHYTTRALITQYSDPLSSPKLPLVTSARFWWSRIYVWLEGVGVICTSFSELFKLHKSIFIFISSILHNHQCFIFEQYGVIYLLLCSLAVLQICRKSKFITHHRFSQKCYLLFHSLYFVI